MTNSSNQNTSSANTTHVVNRRATGTDRQKVQQEKHPVQSSNQKPTRWVQMRLFPIWLRLIIIAGLIFLAMVGGYHVGFTILGDGTSNGWFDLSTWKHILDIINGKE